MPDPSDATSRILSAYESYDASPKVRIRRSPFNRGNQAIASERDARFESSISSYLAVSRGDARVVDAGCGSGHLLAKLIRWGFAPSHLVGVDLLPDRIAVAQSTCPGAAFHITNADKIPVPSTSVDLVCCWTLFSSIPDRPLAARVAGEIDRILKPGGVVGWYDFRFIRPTNRHTRGMTRAEIASLFPAYHLHLETITVAPPIARRLGRSTARLYPIVARLPILRSHYLGFLTHP